jgi:hypothetical protein
MSNMAIAISYSVGEDDETCESFREAVRRRGGYEDVLWLVINGERVLELPATFNRCVAVEGKKVNSAVIHHREADNGHNAFPLPDRFPMLIFDFDHGRVDWLPDGIGHRVVNLYLEGAR